VSAKPVFLIVGASLAGAKAAEELRTQGFDGRVPLVGAGPERPYERPPLTKDYRAGQPVPAAALADPATTLESLAGELTAGR
jgi:NADPH-dependent 2,4-dienoyl-CoA reductase/sulfur reductase-like enzyme